MVPGMNHCKGGPGANVFTCSPASRLGRARVAPDRILATHYVNNLPDEGVASRVLYVPTREKLYIREAAILMMPPILCASDRSKKINVRPRITYCISSSAAIVPTPSQRSADEDSHWRVLIVVVIRDRYSNRPRLGGASMAPSGTLRPSWAIAPHRHAHSRRLESLPARSVNPSRAHSVVSGLITHDQCNLRMSRKHSRVGSLSTMKYPRDE